MIIFFAHRGQPLFSIKKQPRLMTAQEVFQFILRGITKCDRGVLYSTGILTSALKISLISISRIDEAEVVLAARRLLSRPVKSHFMNPLSIFTDKSRSAWAGWQQYRYPQKNSRQNHPLNHCYRLMKNINVIVYD